MSEVRLPRLLDADMREKKRLHPIRSNVSLSLTPISTAVINLPPDESVGIHDFMELYTTQGSAGIYRVASIRKTYTDTTTINLEHGLTCLGDGIIPGEGKYTGTLQEVVEQILNSQVTAINGEPMFAVGDCADVTAEYTYDHTNVLSALKELCEQLGDYAITCDQSAVPWRVGIRALDTNVTCEGRLSRNIEDMQVSFDDSELCTVIYCEMLEGDTKTIKGETVDQYGVIMKTISATQSDDQKSLKEYINQYLADHAEPTVSIQISALELSHITGEPMDHFTVGALCRLALPDYGVQMNERILTVEFQNVYGMPEKVNLTLKNRLRDTRKDIASLENNLSSSTSKNKVGTSRGSGLTPAKLIDMLVQEDYVYDENGGSHFKSKIDLTAQGVRLSANEEHIDYALDRVSLAEASINVNSHNIELKVSKDGVISSINQTAEAVRISASKINLDGYVTASEFSTLQANLANVMSGTVQASTLWTQNLTATNTVRLCGHTISANSMDVVTKVSYSKQLQNVPGGNGVTYAVISSVTVSSEKDTIYYLGW